MELKLIYVLSLTFALLLALGLSIAALATDGYRFRCLLATGNSEGFAALTFATHSSMFEYRLRFALPPEEGELLRVVLRGPRIDLNEAPDALVLCGESVSCSALESYSCLLNQLPEQCGEFSRLLAAKDTSMTVKDFGMLMRELRSTPHLFFLAAETAATPDGAYFSKTLGDFCEVLH